MEETTHQPTEEKPIDPNACISCGKLEFEEGYSNKLCIDCRTKYANFPIPKWITGFAAILGILMLIGFFQMNKSISAALHLSRGLKAEEQHKYKTAAGEFDKVLEVFPNVLEPNAHAIIVNCYLLNSEKVTASYQRIKNEKSEDLALIKRVDEALNGFQNYIPLDSSVVNDLDNIPDDSVEQFESYRKKYIENNPGDVAAKYFFADKLYQRKDYAGSEKELNTLLEGYPDFQGAILLMSAVKRQQGKYDEALDCCDHLLKINVENTSAVAQKARIELKRKNDVAAKKYAIEALKMDGEAPSSLEAMAMVDFYNNQVAESQKLLAKIKKIEGEGDHFVSARLEKILNGTEKFRD